MTALAYDHSWDNPYVVTLSFKTSVIVSRSGLEQRRALRTEPRRSIDVAFVLDSAQTRDFDRLARRERANRVTFTDPVSLDTLTVRLPQSFSASHRSAGSTEVSLTLAVDPGTETFVDPVLDPTYSYQGRYVLPAAVNWRAALTEDYLLPRETVDYDRGRIAVSTPVRFATKGPTATVLTEDLTLVDYFRNARGRQGDFWAVSALDDLALAQPVSGTTMTVFGDATEPLEPLRRITSEDMSAWLDTLPDGYDGVPAGEWYDNDGLPTRVPGPQNEPAPSGELTRITSALMTDWLLSLPTSADPGQWFNNEGVPDRAAGSASYTPPGGAVLTRITSAAMSDWLDSLRGVDAAVAGVLRVGEWYNNDGLPTRVPGAAASIVLTGCLYQGVMVKLTNGHRYFRRVVEAQKRGGLTDLTLDDDFPETVSPAVIQRLTSITNARFASDDMSVQWLTNEVGETQVQLQSLPWAPPENPIPFDDATRYNVDYLGGNDVS